MPRTAAIRIAAGRAVVPPVAFLPVGRLIAAGGGRDRRGAAAILGWTGRMPASTVSASITVG